MNAASPWCSPGCGCSGIEGATPAPRRTSVTAATTLECALKIGAPRLICVRPRIWLRCFLIWVTVIGSFGASPAQAQDRTNPFESSAEILARRAPAAAADRFVYEQTVDGKAEIVSILVAPDWSAIESSNGTNLWDFADNRLYAIAPDGKTYQNLNGAALVAFRVLELQNRQVIYQVIAQASNTNRSTCSIESELGIALPNLPDSGLKISKKRDTLVAQCGKQVVAEIVPSDSERASPQFWAGLANSISLHPKVWAELIKAGAPPAFLKASASNLPGVEPQETVLRLQLHEKGSFPFPLTAAMRPEPTPGLVEMLGSLAQDAAKGVAGGGPPTLDAWQRMANTDLTEFGLQSLYIFSAFPEAAGKQCASEPPCPHILDVREAIGSDPAVGALYDLAQAERAGDKAGVLAAMRQAQATPQRQHPAILASWALALRNIEGLAEEAGKANLPTDSTALTTEAIKSYPYAVGYWVDLGQILGADYDYASTFMVFEVAESLPVPGAGSDLAKQYKSIVGRLRRDFPLYFPD